MDAGEKLAGYFRVPSVRHYLIVSARRREVIHHARQSEKIETSIVTAGRIELDPPGISLAVEDFYTGLDL